MVTQNQAGIDFDQHPPRTADGRDANQVYATNKGIVHNPRETDEHKREAQDVMFMFEEAERRTADGYRGTILDHTCPDTTKLNVATRWAQLPRWEELTKKERMEEAERLGMVSGRRQRQNDQ